MWCEERANGKFKFVERYLNPITGIESKVSVTLDKNTSATRKRAQKILDKKIDDSLKKITVVSKNYTINNLVEAYLKEQERTVKKSTYRRNYFTSESFKKALGEDTLLEQLTSKYVRTKWLDTEGKNSTLNERLKRWKGILRWGYQNEYISDIRFLDKLTKLPDNSYREKIEDKFLETDDFLKLMSGMQNEKWKLLTQFLGLSGMRIGEAIALKKTDVDFSNRIIHVSETHDSNNDLDTSPKSSASYRDVYMQDDLYDCAKKLKNFMALQRLRLGYPNSDLFLQHDDGSHIKYYTYNKYIKENALRILGRDKVTPHILRHTHTCILAENGVLLETITRRLGHEDSEITRQVYLHVTKKMRQHDNEQIAAVRIM